MLLGLIARQCSEVIPRCGAKGHPPLPESEVRETKALRNLKRKIGSFYIREFLIERMIR